MLEDVLEYTVPVCPNILEVLASMRETVQKRLKRALGIIFPAVIVVPRARQLLKF